MGMSESGHIKIKTGEREMKLISSIATASALLVSAATVAQAEETLIIHHMLSAKAPSHASMMGPWAEALAKDSGGELKAEIFPSMSLGGKPPELYSQVRDGTVDIIWSVPNYTPGVFPRSEVFELPDVHKGSATATNMAIQETFSMIAEDYKDVKPLLIHVHTGQLLHMVDKKITNVSQMEGLKMRIPGRTGNWALEAWGSEGVGMPVPAFPQALSKNVVDGGMIPFEIMLPLKTYELTKYIVQGPDSARFGTSVFMYVMNKDRYNSLPANLKAVIDKNSGIEFAEAMGKVWDDVEKVGDSVAKKNGVEIVTLSQSAYDGFINKAAPVSKRWVAEMNEKGLDGQKLYDAAKAAVAKYSR
jgi:TRAP-type C4-dicarboxylate transport system substrate-binding protein